MRYLLSGIFFGIVLIKSEVVSWFRIQEMFRFDAFHMYGVIGSAVLVGMLSIQLVKYYRLRDMEGKPISVSPKDSSQMYRYSIGGLLFGFGWALTGACPGPLFALLGSGWTIMVVPIISAIIGTWVYGLLRPRIPH